MSTRKWRYKVKKLPLRCRFFKKCVFDHYTVRIVQKMMCLAEDEFRILRGKKLLCSVGVRQQILRYLLPEAAG